jgi:sentrin-specific protease 1
MEAAHVCHTQSLASVATLSKVPSIVNNAQALARSARNFSTFRRDTDNCSALFARQYEAAHDVHLGLFHGRIFLPSRCKQHIYYAANEGRQRVTGANSQDWIWRAACKLGQKGLVFFRPRGVGAGAIASAAGKTIILASGKVRDNPKLRQFLRDVGAGVCAVNAEAQATSSGMADAAADAAADAQEVREGLGPRITLPLLEGLRPHVVDPQSCPALDVVTDLDDDTLPVSAPATWGAPAAAEPSMEWGMLAAAKALAAEDAPSVHEQPGCQELLFVFIPLWAVAVLRANYVKGTHMDHTYGVDVWGHLLFNIVVFNRLLRGMRVCWSLTENEQASTTADILFILRTFVDIDLSYVVMDKSAALAKAVITVFANVHIRLCRFHVVQAWTAKAKKVRLSAANRDLFVSLMRQAMDAPTKDALDQAVKALWASVIFTVCPALKTYVARNWLNICPLWCKACWVEAGQSTTIIGRTNNVVEAKNKNVKSFAQCVGTGRGLVDAVRANVAHDGIEFLRALQETGATCKVHRSLPLNAKTVHIGRIPEQMSQLCTAAQRGLLFDVQEMPPTMDTCKRMFRATLKDDQCVRASADGSGLADSDRPRLVVTCDVPDERGVITVTCSCSEFVNDLGKLSVCCHIWAVCQNRMPLISVHKLNLWRTVLNSAVDARHSLCRDADLAWRAHIHSFGLPPVPSEDEHNEFGVHGGWSDADDGRCDEYRIDAPVPNSGGHGVALADAPTDDASSASVTFPDPAPASDTLVMDGRAGGGVAALGAGTHAPPHECGTVTRLALPAGVSPRVTKALTRAFATVAACCHSVGLDRGQLLHFALSSVKGLTGKLAALQNIGEGQLRGLTDAQLHDVARMNAIIAAIFIEEGLVFGVTDSAKSLVVCGGARGMGLDCLVALRQKDKTVVQEANDKRRQFHARSSRAKKLRVTSLQGVVRNRNIAKAASLGRVCVTAKLPVHWRTWTARLITTVLNKTPEALTRLEATVRQRTREWCLERTVRITGSDMQVKKVHTAAWFSRFLKQAHAIGREVRRLAPTKPMRHGNAFEDEAVEQLEHIAGSVKCFLWREMRVLLATGKSEQMRDRRRFVPRGQIECFEITRPGLCVDISKKCIGYSPDAVMTVKFLLPQHNTLGMPTAVLVRAQDPLRLLVEVKCPQTLRRTDAIIARKTSLVGWHKLVGYNGYHVPVRPEHQRQVLLGNGVTGTHATLCVYYLPYGKNNHAVAAGARAGFAPRAWWREWKRVRGGCRFTPHTLKYNAVRAMEGRVFGTGNCKVVVLHSYSVEHPDDTGECNCSVLNVLTSKGFVQVVRLPDNTAWYQRMVRSMTRFWTLLCAPMLAMLRHGCVRLGSSSNVAAMLNMLKTEQKWVDDAHDDGSHDVPLGDPPVRMLPGIPESEDMGCRAVAAPPARIANPRVESVLGRARVASGQRMRPADIQTRARGASYKERCRGYASALRHRRVTETSADVVHAGADFNALPSASATALAALARSVGSGAAAAVTAGAGAQVRGGRNASIAHAWRPKRRGPDSAGANAGPHSLPDCVAAAGGAWGRRQSPKVTVSSGAMHSNDDAVIRTASSAQLDRRVTDLRVGDLQRLLPGQWLNDVVVNWYMALLDQAQPTIGFMSSFLLVAFHSVECGTKELSWVHHSYARRYTEPRAGERVRSALLGLRLIFIPLHCGGVHWCLGVVDVHERRIYVLDSLVNSDTHETGRSEEIALFFKCMPQFLAMSAQGGDDGGARSWTCSVNPSQQQDNSSDCGVFVCANAHSLALPSTPHDVRPHEMDNWRKYIRDVLLGSKTLRQ